MDAIEYARRVRDSLNYRACPMCGERYHVAEMHVVCKKADDASR